jgi:RNA 3'-terminal phosphate cyclase
MTTKTTMTPEQWLALANLVSDKETKAAKASLNPGTFDIQPFTVSVTGGTVALSAPVEYTPTVHLPLLDVMVIALHRAGFQRDGIMALIEGAAIEALNADTGVGAKLKSEVDYVKVEVEALQARLSSNLPKATRSGPCKVRPEWQ